MLWRPARSSDWLVSVRRNSEFERIDSSRIECEIVLSSSSGSFLQRDVEHGHQDFVEHARRVQLARRFQKQRELFQVGRFLLDLDSGNPAEKFPGSVRSGMSRIEEDVRRIARPKLQAVTALQFLTLDTLSVDERAVLAAQVNEEKLLPVLHDLRMVPRDPRVRNHQILVDLPSDRERRAVQNDVLLLATLHKDKGGKHTGARSVMTDCAKGHEWSFSVPFAVARDDGHARCRDISCCNRLLCWRVVPQGTGLAPPGVQQR